MRLAARSAAADADTGSDAGSGQRIGAYEVVRETGRRGMGTVLLARRAGQAFEQE